MCLHNVLDFQVKSKSLEQMFNCTDLSQIIQLLQRPDDAYLESDYLDKGAHYSLTTSQIYYLRRFITITQSVENA